MARRVLYLVAFCCLVAGLALSFSFRITSNEPDASIAMTEFRIGLVGTPLYEYKHVRTEKDGAVVSIESDVRLNLLSTSAAAVALAGLLAAIASFLLPGRRASSPGTAPGSP
jgi:hypothetical protein